MSTNLTSLRMALMNGARTCNLVSPAKMTAVQRTQYEHAHICLEQLGELLLNEGDFRHDALSLLDKIRKMR